MRIRYVSDLALARWPSDLRRSALTELADHTATVPCEGTSHFPSLTASMAVVHAILAEITRTLGEPARAAMRATEDCGNAWT
jgi:DNA-binding MurR/RpiR family transcriptional regulator